MSTILNELAAELGVLPEDQTHAQRALSINGPSGGSGGIRSKYISALNALAAQENWSEAKRADVGASIAWACDHSIAIKTPLADKDARIALSPIDTLNDEERNSLT